MSDSMSDSTTAKNLTILIGGLVLLTFGIAGLVALIVYSNDPEAFIAKDSQGDISAKLTPCWDAWLLSAVLISCMGAWQRTTHPDGSLSLIKKVHYALGNQRAFVTSAQGLRPSAWPRRGAT